MPTPDGVMWFAKSQPCQMHFKNQRALIVRKKATFSKSKRLPSVKRLTQREERGKVIGLTPTADC
jgi:hypothetical protein